MSLTQGSNSEATILISSDLVIWVDHVQGDIDKSHNEHGYGEHSDHVEVVGYPETKTVDRVFSWREVKVEALGVFDFITDNSVLFLFLTNLDWTFREGIPAPITVV